MINLTDGIQCTYIAENACASAIFSSANFSYVDISVSGRSIVANEDELSIIKNSKTFPETRLMRERKSRINDIWKDVFTTSFEGMERHREVLKNWLALLPNRPDVDEFGRPWELHKRTGRTPMQQRYFIIIKNRMVNDR